MAPLELDSILKSLTWQYDLKICEFVALESALHSAQRELFQHGREVYNEYTSRLSHVLNQAQFVFEFRSYDEWKAIMYHPYQVRTL